MMTRRRKNRWVITDRALGWTLAIIVLTLTVAVVATLPMGNKQHCKSRRPTAWY
jgi:hypothetical protein